MPLCQNRIACRSVAKIQRTRVINAHMLLRDVYQVVTALDRFLMIGAKVLGIFVLKERKFQGMKVLGTLALEERKFKGANVPWNESSTGTKVPSVDFLLPWTKVQRNEKSEIRISLCAYHTWCYFPSTVDKSYCFVQAVFSLDWQIWRRLQTLFSVHHERILIPTGGYFPSMADGKSCSLQAIFRHGQTSMAQMLFSFQGGQKFIPTGGCFPYLVCPICMRLVTCIMHKH